MKFILSQHVLVRGGWGGGGVRAYVRNQGVGKYIKKPSRYKTRETVKKIQQESTRQNTNIFKQLK
jgi:hypothetical protein